MNWNRKPFERLLSACAATLLFAGVSVAQLPTSVDIDLVEGPTANTLDVRLRANGTSFGQVLSALTFTVRWVDTSPATLTAGSSPWCSGASFPIAPTTMVLDGGFKYRTYNAISLVALDDEDNGGCGATLPADTWVVVHRITVNNNTGCTAFQILNDAYTASANRNFFISLNGVARTGAIQANNVLRGSCAPDCLGVIGGTALPGTPCNDNDDCTINDVYTGTAPNCGCAGTFQDTDSDGVCDANDPCPTQANVVPGQSCNDGDDCTINDVVTANCGCAGTFQDTDSDGVCDASDPCPTQANVVPGQSCNDGDDCTINDVVTANCGCAGTFQDTDSDGVCDASDPCPTQANVVPGQSCNDGDDCTINDVVTANCGCAGTFQDTDSDGTCDANDPCPTQANVVPGQSCNDGDDCTINDVVTANCGCAGTFQDTDSDGVCDASDPCPTQANVVPGQSCNDGDDCTINDVVTANCGCAGTFQDTDSDGVCDASDPCPTQANVVPGQSCNDGDDCTINDVVTANCGCAGTFQDTDSDGVCDASDPCPTQANVVPGQSCNDGDDCTINDVVTANCGCAGTFQDSDSDGVCDANDACPLLANLVNGDPCDDGNANTVNDVVTNCICAGTLLDDDCEGVPGGPAQPGTACNDNDDCTINDLWDANCNCAGTFQDTDSDGVCDANDPCPTQANVVPGQSCNDGDDCTINDVVTANCGCAGTFQDTDSDGVCDASDPCPTQANVVPGQSCNDGDDCTINDVVTANCACAGTFQDSDSDGVCDANDACPLLANLVNGDPCDDGNANTVNDVVTNCICAGTLLDDDCEGVPGGPAQPGTACNDNDDCTINDLYDANCNCAGTFQDTDSDGVCDANDPCPTQANVVPGQNCNDGDDCTINDVVTANCGCAGTFQDTDSDGVCDASDPCPTQANVVPGQSCNDGDDCTINDVVTANCGCAGTFQDSDSDGVCDANDACPLLANLVNGDPCDDGNANTVNDVVTNCICAGTLLDDDCEGVPGGPAQPGTACNDNDDCTINDLWDANCNCAGTFQDTDSDGVCDANDACPLLANLVNGDPCDDGNANTVNDVVTNCICAGTLLDDDCEGVPGGPAQPGTACNDNDDCTINDLWDANCNCAGTFQDTDSDGVCDANDACPLLPVLVNGDPCDDGNANTVNDVVTNCICAGTLLDDDCEGVPGGPAQPGTACNDNDDCTINDLWDANCNCAGTFQDTDSDGVCDANDNCPTVVGQIGEACDDGNIGTENDVLNANCECQGTPVGGCDHPVNLVIETDANGSETSWEIVLQGTEIAVCSGGPYPGVDNSFIGEQCCLTSACYVLHVFDSAGDGMTTGGYVLARLTGGRIIDNRDNGAGFTTESALANGEGFCLPLGSDEISVASCDKEWWLTGDILNANVNPAVSAVWSSFPAGSPERSSTGYQMWWFNPNGSYSFRRYQSHNTTNSLPASAVRASRFVVNGWLGNQLQEGELYNVRVRSRILGTYSEFGPACRFRLDAQLAECPPTQLVNIPGHPEYSCGVTRQAPSNQKIWAFARQGADIYQFRFSVPSEGITFNRNSPTHWIALSGPGGNAFQNGTTYEVQVRISKDNGATWCPFGEACSVTIDNGGSEMILADDAGNGAAADIEARMTVWPNPNRGELLNMSIAGIPVPDAVLTINLYDMLGNQVVSTTRAAQEGIVNGALELPASIGTGVYVVQVTGAGGSWTERIMIQR